MITTLIRGALVAFTVGTSFVGLGASPASAQEVRIVIGDGIRGEPVQYRDYDGRRDRDYDRRDRGFDRRDRDFDRRDRYERRDFGDRCRSRLALRKAFGLGLNRPRIVREGRRSVVVEGSRRGRFASVIFANDRGCPVLEFSR